MSGMYPYLSYRPLLYVKQSTFELTLDGSALND